MNGADPITGYVFLSGGPFGGRLLPASAPGEQVVAHTPFVGVDALYERYHDQAVALLVTIRDNPEGWPVYVYSVPGETFFHPERNN